MTKQEARAYVNKMRKTLDEDEFAASSRRVFDNLKTVDAFREAENVLIYVSYNKEVDTYAIMEYCFDMGKKVFVPKVYGDEMKFHRIRSLGDLAVGKFGIMEPDNVFCDEWENVSGVMIMPGVAFDYRLNRAGYGGGFYDRYLSKHNSFFKIAICFDFQLVSELEVQEHDLKPDMIICGNKILNVLGEYHK